ncbi:MAG TPA: hypothetical protein VHS52_00440 [Acidimicrobiales bacterium]|jgi:hypothetical protein|nr:hypothetical protein [Acidimicrobiales bacterium]
MTAPDNVPVTLAEQPRRSLPLPPARRWAADRPGDLEKGQPRGPRLGSPGPDQGYAFNLAKRFADRVQTVKGEHVDDVLAGCTAVALRRASLFGRAPVVHDLELALALWGFLGDAPADLVEFRRSHFAGAAHGYWDQRNVTDLVPEATLRMTPAQVKARSADWRSLLAV